MLKKYKCPLCGGSYETDVNRIEKLFRIWSRSAANLGETMLVEKLITEYGYDNVETAFIEACADEERVSIAYVRGILKGEYRKAATAKAKQEAASYKAVTAGSGKIGGFTFNEILKKVPAAKAQTPELDTPATNPLPLRGLPLQSKGEIKPRIDREKARKEFIEQLEKDLEETTDEETKDSIRRSIEQLKKKII